MAGGFVKDALGDMLVSMQRNIESLQRQSSSGKILPCDVALVTPSSPQPSPPPAVSAEYYRHADFVQCWFNMNLPAGFTGGSGPFILNLPWALKAAPGGGQSGLLGTWRGTHIATGQVAVGEVWSISDADGRVYFWYVNASPIGGYQYLSATTPWTWGAGDVFQGQFNGHIVTGH